eukprot:1158269-Pelagomonas_calceolata.AAC.24
MKPIASWSGSCAASAVQCEVRYIFIKQALRPWEAGGVTGCVPWQSAYTLEGIPHRGGEASLNSIQMQEGDKQTQTIEEGYAP